MSWRDQVAESAEGRSPGSTGYVYVNCPACSTRVGKTDYQRKCSVDMERGWIRCWRCDWRSRLPGDWVDEGEVYEEEEDAWEEYVPDFEQPSDYGPITLAASRFLRRRHVDRSVWDRFDLGYARSGEHRGRIIIPVVVGGGAWVGWVGRYIGEGRRPYHTSTGLERGRFFVGDRAIEEGRMPLVVTEGPFDVLHQAVNTDVAFLGCMGKPTEDHIKRVAAARRPTVIALDGDAWREGLGYARALRAAGRPAYAFLLPAGEDLGSLPVDFVADGVGMALRTGQDIDAR